MNKHFEWSFSIENIVMKESNRLERSELLYGINNLNFVSVQEKFFKQVKLVDWRYVNDQVERQIQFSDGRQLTDAKYIFD